ncbi:HDL563Cp [Eremothecium sinecaudum]|uniref:HDL563Cp n=1 Tax=Eremothecium sinecaudum TaxID=45286 RepID=A0A0X8HRN8_9SACH|nr:HDL563Cp [Eremothecium sinecaudum]AMD20181.1 HDL563Cp [Eremothecium sinecaudum]
MEFINWIVYGLLINGVLGHVIPSTGDELLNNDFSLSELVHITDLPSQWKLLNDAVFDEGRVILTPKSGSKGSLWNANNYKIDRGFTIEWTFRSVGYFGKSKGGISFWLLNNAKGDNPLPNESKYDGLQILIDNYSNLESTARAVFSDGTKQLTRDDMYDQTFGSCLLSYQSSSVPMTLRLSYDPAQTMLKLQIDNRVCFQTKHVKLPTSNYRIGVSATNDETTESFEILKHKVFDGLTTGAKLPNLKAMGQPHLVTKRINYETGEEQLVEASPLEVSGSDFSNVELYKKIDRLEGKVLANDVSHIANIVKNLLAAEQENAKRIAAMEKFLEVLVSKSGDENKDISGSKELYKDFYQVNQNLEKLFEEQQKIREANKRHEALANSGPHADEIVAKLIIWLIPLGIVMIIMAYYTFRIRQDIVKAKLL